MPCIFQVSSSVREITADVANCCRFGSLLACETFHADVHAGNLLVLQDGRVGFIDFGKSYHLFNIAMQWSNTCDNDKQFEARTTSST